LIQVKYTSDYAELILNYPNKLNAMGSQFLRQLNSMLNDIRHHEKARLLVIKSAVPGVFCSGVDLKELHGFPSVEEARNFAILFDNTLIGLLKFPKPVVAVLDGLAFGGGFALASAADLRIITDNGKIAFPAGQLGAILPPSATLMLQALIGQGHSRDLLLTGRKVLADEALRIGLVNRFSKVEQLKNILYQTIRQILLSGDLALELTRRTVNQPLLADIEKYNHTSAENFAFLSATNEWKKRMAGFVKQRTKT